MLTTSALPPPTAGRRARLVTSASARLPGHGREAGFHAAEALAKLGDLQSHLRDLLAQLLDIQMLAGRLLRGGLHEDALAGLPHENPVRLQLGYGRPHRVARPAFRFPLGSGGDLAARGVLAAG